MTKASLTDRYAGRATERRCLEMADADGVGVVTAFVERTTRSSGVPLVVEDPAVIADLVRVMER